mgnify:CR=1 FL=1
MKKGIISLLMGICLISITVGNTSVHAVSKTEIGAVKTIVVADGDYGNNDPARVYQLVGKKMNKTNRTMSTFNDKGIVHWHAQEIQADGEQWWKVGENQYFKPARVNVVNLDAMKAHGLTVKNYANFDGKNGVSMIDEG